MARRLFTLETAYPVFFFGINDSGLFSEPIPLIVLSAQMSREKEAFIIPSWGPSVNH